MRDNANEPAGVHLHAVLQVSEMLAMDLIDNEAQARSTTQQRLKILGDDEIDELYEFGKQPDAINLEEIIQQLVRIRFESDLMPTA
jgi:hypothetical protein